MIYAGIDSGFTGGIAIYDSDNTTWTAHKMPVQKTDVSKELDYKKIGEILKNVDIVAIEKAHTFPGNGAKHSFSYGGQYFSLKCILTMLEKPFTLINVTRWKRAMLEGMNKTDKKASIARAKQLVPSLRDIKITDGQAEAVLICYYHYNCLGA